MPGACYAVLEEGGAYRSAVRWEPYADGVLISALETVPEMRRKGYGEQLLREVLRRTDRKVYSHIAKKMPPLWLFIKNAAFAS